ncbi:hypothetical protein [Mycobacteroides saopaulense]|uniref:Uncharacterized protein n=1 Tax=Mycobacteroides saopaulense TaxID=1578165 RepID=A0ABX3C525_9MYCO|nr:hypothetical protein [Mycobacteroides saopaulense]OHT88843.1 hypothetical protein BKG68_02890 [Mycobacteroides saopaulense]OHU13663.1 hypothetical protein BKG73_02895 [Mycobacteroides saopaulense]
MSRIQVFSAARTAGNTAWWVFVVAALVNRGLNPQGWDYGWTAYTPLTDGMPRRYADYVPFEPVAVQLVGVIAWIAFCAVVIAAVLELAVVRRWAAVVSVVMPFVSLGLIVYAFGGLDRTIVWSPTAVLVLVLAAIATRQVWMIRFAPAVGK